MVPAFVGYFQKGEVRYRRRGLRVVHLPPPEGRGFTIEVHFGRDAIGFPRPGLYLNFLGPLFRRDPDRLGSGRPPYEEGRAPGLLRCVE